MTLTLERIEFLRSAKAQSALADLAEADLRDARTLALVTWLRREYRPEEAGDLLEQARLRQRAVSKFGPSAARMLFERVALEQASDPLVRAWRATQLRDYSILDICCGIGTDSLALAEAGARVRGIDIDPVRIALARHNAEVLGLPAVFEVGDAHTAHPAPDDGIFFDPARRTSEGRRIFHVEQYIPPLSLIRRWPKRVCVVKLAPGVEEAQVADYGGWLDFISVDGDLKEALLWPGPAPQRLRAVRLAENSANVLERAPGDVEPPVRLSAPAAWLVEPDPAILRANLVRDLAEELGCAMLDETIAYLTSADLPASPWVRGWRILEWMPFQLKRLRTQLRQRGIGRVTVKKRGSPITPEALIADLRLKGDEAATLVLTRLAGQPIVLICDEHPADGDIPGSG